MATTSSSGLDNNNNTPIKNRDIISSTFHQTVCLQDWWLIKSEKEFEGKRLAVGGLALREQRAARIFHSAPIIKRYDLFTLKTADGITILIKGKINISHTLENGFSSEVYNHFMLGFPYYWETYADQCFEKEVTGRGVPTSMSGSDESSLPDCLGGKAVTRTLNHLISSLAASVSSVLTKNINADVLEKCSGHDLESPTVPISADVKGCSPGTGDSLPEETPSNKEKSKSERNHGHDKGLLYATEEENVDNGGKLLSNKQDNLNTDGCNNEPESEVSKGNSFKEKLENSIDIPVLHMDAEVVKSSDIEPLATKETLIDKKDGGDKETTENENNILSDKQDYLNNDGSNEPESQVLKENSFRERVEISADDIPVMHLNAEVVKSSDIEPLASKEALIDKEDGGINEETMEIVENLLSDNQDNLNHDGCNEPESEVLKENSFKEKLGNSADDIPVLHLNAEVVKSSDIEPPATKEILIDKEDGGIVTLSNTSNRTTRNSVKNLRNYDTASDEHSVPTGFDLKLFPSVVGKSVPAENLSPRLSEGFKKSGNNRQDKVRAVGSLKSKRTKLCSSVPQDYEADMVSLVEVTGNAGGNSSFRNNTFDGIVEKHASTSPNEGIPKFSSKIRKCNNIKMKDDALRNRSTSIPSDLNDANPSKVNIVLPEDLKSSSEKLESSKSNRKDSNKTKGSLRSEGSANIGCHYDTGKDDSSKDASASIGSDVKSVCLYEINAAVPVDISSNYTTTSSKVRGGVKKRRRGRPKKEQINSSSVSGSQGYVVVPELFVEQKLIHGSSVGIERNLEESLSKTPYVGSPEISDRAANCSPRTMEDSTAQRNLESNISSSTEVRMGTINVTPNKGAATRTSDRLKNIVGEGDKNTTSNCHVEDENNVPTATSEAIEKPGRKHLIGSCASSPSSHKTDSVKEIGSLSEGRRTSSRLKNLANKWKEDQPTYRRLECKRNKVNSIFVGSDFVKSDVDKVDCEPGGRSALDQPNIGVPETLPGQTELDNQSSKDGSQMNCMLSSVPIFAVEKVNCKSAIDGAESNEQSKSCISSIMLGNMKHASDLKMSKEREESEDSKPGTCGRKTKRKPVLPSPETRSRRKNLCLVSPEDLSLKRSRSGRLLVPPLDFWRNQQVVYGEDGRITGVQDGLPVLESSTGAKSEPPKAKRKLI
ncbi:SANT associated [Macleaya cordata]|uniref:SANT associated n=1 Tax=Macleaya cordata TaxID=56857 RepID=A0A200R6G1_MACCD|nr:SANT associated [Macleaya cordata]